MKRFTPVLLAIGLAVLVGCQPASNPAISTSAPSNVTTSPDVDVSPTGTSEFTLVTLTVPNMV